MAPELYNIQVDRDVWAGFGAPDNSWIRSVVHDLTTDDVAGYDHTVDYWALGVTMYQLMTGRVSILSICYRIVISVTLRFLYF